MKTMTLELRATEGGTDSRVFAAELAGAYLRLAMKKRGCFDPFFPVASQRKIR